MRGDVERAREPTEIYSACADWCQYLPFVKTKWIPECKDCNATAVKVSKHGFVRSHHQEEGARTRRAYAATSHAADPAGTVGSFSGCKTWCSFVPGSKARTWWIARSCQGCPPVAGKRSPFANAVAAAAAATTDADNDAAAEMKGSREKPCMEW